MVNTQQPALPLPTRKAAALFQIKAKLFQLQRILLNQTLLAAPAHPVGQLLAKQEIVAESKSDLWTGNDNLALQYGKVENLRIALRALNGVEVAAGELFSFWAQIGRPTRGKGYVVGRELRQGCLIPNLGGGLCQLSNALYDAALKADFEIVERHAHSKIIPGSLAEIGRDATVFWNYVDL